jgi:resuscitation-promoting factor RpfB
MPGPAVPQRLYLKIPPEKSGTPGIFGGQIGCNCRTGFLIVILLAFLAGCSSPVAPAQASIHVSIQADGKNAQVTVPSGSSVDAALIAANLAAGTLDRTEPPLTSVLNADSTVHLIRIEETYDVRQETVPFERQSVRNESLPDGDTRLIQPGVNGVKEITYRRVLEDGKEISHTAIKESLITDPVPEIVMVGVQMPFSPLPVPGKIAYLTGGNGWVIETTTGLRHPVVTTGDLDGHVFSLSPDGGWLLFSRKGSKSDPKAINSLWIASTGGSASQLVDIRVANVIQFAAWNPLLPMTVEYSTVEPRSTAPGWQANNDLKTITFTAGGVIGNRKTLIEPSSGGIYGWWGTTFAWSRDGQKMAYARPDQVGVVDLKSGQLVPRMAVTPFQSHSDWAWVPGLAWNPDGSVLWTVDHGPDPTNAGSSPEESPVFHLSFVLFPDQKAVPMTSQTGMFAYPTPSPALTDGSYRVAYLQAVFPERSDTSRYRLFLMDQDGSNQKALYPAEGGEGLTAQEVVWSPKAFESGFFALAVIDAGNLWLVETDGSTHQVTGDGSVSRVDWK